MDEKNRMATALVWIGCLAILGGLIIGISEYDVQIEGYEYLSEKDYGILFTWIAYGVIAGIIFFAFAEVINLLHNILYMNEKSRDSIDEVKHELKQLNRKK